MWFRRRYGAGPLHLLALLACVTLAAYVVNRLVVSGPLLRILIWFGGSVVAHDLVLWPLYALADRAGVRASRRDPSHLPRVPWINHVRVPVVIAAVLLAVSFPLVLHLSERNYHAATGLTQKPYLDRYLLIIGCLFAASALLYAVRLGRAGGRRTGRDPAPETSPGDEGAVPEMGRVPGD